MRFGVALYFFLTFLVSISGYASDAAANISGPTTNATGRYTLTHATKAEYLKTGIFFSGGGASYRSISVGNGSKDVYIRDSGVYTYRAQADGSYLFYDPMNRCGEEYGEPLEYGSHTLYVIDVGFTPFIFSVDDPLLSAVDSTLEFRRFCIDRLLDTDINSREKIAVES
ncbi:hypothetical protein [Microbulbifer sp. GL-2]|uniref:hypothetical protein n=1 Tax=Microbulbifer sp. GL-2 TaxID=2591606 RepID=UPI001164922A|nr:hypothetical protein [Microbulbifer sp. GL-2]BBM03582.1 hypothetical protein GL2_36560 [Microbulbifer sp. GL-2]